MQTTGVNPDIMCYTQANIEREMYGDGIERAKRMMAEAEAGGRSADMPYSKEILRDFVIPIAGVLDEAINKNAAGYRGAYVTLLEGLDMEVVAFLTVRHVLSTQMGENPENHRQMASSIGRVIQQEMLLCNLEATLPELYHTLVQDMGRRQSKSATYRHTVMRLQAQKAGIVFVEWPLGAREHVGMYILSVLQDAELIVLGTEIRAGFKRVARDVYIHPDVMERVNQVKGYVEVSMPVYGPCIEPPLDWTSPTEGGFHSHTLRRTNRHLVHGNSLTREHVGKADMPIVLKAVNALQRTAWAVNTDILTAVREIAKNYSTKEIVSLVDKPKPVGPVWLAPGMKAEDMDEGQLAMFKAWKRQLADWYTARKLLASRHARFYSATRQAETFKNFAAIHFVYFADSRGRLYPMTNGMSPQGSDLGKALLRFSEGMPLNTPDAVRWFHVQGANKWGFDKATLEERHQWVLDRREELVAYATDPINCRGWNDAGDPLQFLAWCQEFKRYTEHPDTFLSYLPISMDGSCNGLQNLSAMFRDEVGGEATNLTANKKMKDIYKLVAEAATVRLRALVLTEEDDAVRHLWLAHGINRKLVKRPVMTTPYGVTVATATQHVSSDYLGDTALDHPFERTPKAQRHAARVLMKAVWPAIGDVVVKGREAMSWLKVAARAIVKGLPPDAEPMITWETPSGFPACQSYFEPYVHRIVTRMHGTVKLRVLSETDTPDMARHAGGLAPNFVHSMDAAHLHLTSASAADAGIPALAMIHDDYGTHAANAQALFEIIRRQFVYMYDQHDPIQDFLNRYPEAGASPGRGTLDIHSVLKSDFFFS